MTVVELTQKLLAFNTINPPGNEAPPARFLADMLIERGFAVELRPFGEGRVNLVARKGPGLRAPLCFSGHLDTVPLGLRSWAVDPFGGAIDGDRLYGRGSTDMKGAVAAFVLAAIEECASGAPDKDIMLLITAGEETGSGGARALVQSQTIESPQILVIAEPTSNRVLLGHKGALWLRLQFDGLTAHGSMPEQGRNAVVAAAEAVAALAKYDFATQAHPALATPTLNIGTFHGGINVNSVPDLAEIGVDIRSVPGMDHARVRAEIASMLGPKTRIEVDIDLPPVWTSPDTPASELVNAAVTAITGDRQDVAGATYFTDASVFTPAFGNAPTFILGPGEATMAHKTDEFVLISRLEQAVKIFREIIRRF